MLTLGSLFDGIGGWCLAAKHNGVKPVWSSEIEKFPMAVTRIRFPEVKQLGDVTKIDGAKIEPVDIICAGSPCQDLSTAKGKREGLNGERSGLFTESVRIVRQMQRATGGRYPQFFCWENVPGAYSSNAGNDFRTVLELLTEADIPMPTGGVWAGAGMVECNGCQVAWRTINAEFYGVPQRRRRIFLICDFRGYRAAELLFIESGLRGNSDQICQKRATVAGCVEGSVGNTSECYGIDHVITTGGNCTAQGPCYYKEKCPTLKAAGTHAVANPVCLRMRGGKPGGGKGALLSIDKSLTLAANTNDMVLFENHKEKTFCIQGNTINRKIQNGANGKGVLEELCFTINTIDRHAIANKTVRRLTPRECERLQGLPDGYTLIDDKSCSDSARYKALGNGMAQPCADWIIQRIVEVTEEDEKC